MGSPFKEDYVKWVTLDQESEFRTKGWRQDKSKMAIVKAAKSHRSKTPSVNAGALYPFAVLVEVFFGECVWDKPRINPLLLPPTLKIL